MNIYLIIPNELLLSSCFIDRKVPKCKAKIKIGLDVPQLVDVTNANFSCEISDRKGFTDFPERLACDLNISNTLASVTTRLGIVGVKTTKQMNPMSPKCPALCDQI